jgi:hypothetical protein
VNIPASFYKFWKFETISGIIYLKWKKKKKSTVHGPNPARGYRPRVAVACHTWPAKIGARPWPGGSAQRGKWPACPRHARAPVTLTVWSPRVGRHGGTLNGGSAVARRWQGVAEDLEGTTGEVSGKEERAGAHRNSVPTVRRRKLRRAAAFNGGGVAPVVVDECGEVLQLEGDPRVRRRRSIEGWTSTEGRSAEGADDGDARTEEGFRWREIGRVDAWAVGDECAALGRGRARRTARGAEKFGRRVAGRGAQRGGRR